MSDEEKQYVIDNLPEWQYEGVAWYAYLFSGPNREPIHRFRSDIYQSHFYTRSEEELDFLLATNPEWTYEGIAWYVPAD